MLTTFNDDPDLLIETKAQSSQCKRPEKPRSKKTHQVRSNMKVFMTDFFDWKGVVHHEFLPQGRTVHKKHYLEFIKNAQNCRKCNHEFWTMTTHQLMHRCFSLVFGQKQNRNHASTTVFTRLGPRWLFPLSQNWGHRWKEYILLRLTHSQTKRYMPSILVQNYGTGRHIPSPMLFIIETKQ